MDMGGVQPCPLESSIQVTAETSQVIFGIGFHAS